MTKGIARRWLPLASAMFGLAVTTIADSLRELQKDERVKAESLAMRAFERAREKLSASPGEKAEPARAELRKVADKHPGTEAARLAEELLRSLEPTRKP